MLLSAAVSSRPSGLRVCGVATTHPYAVRALENAAGPVCDPAAVAPIAAAVVAASGGPYVHGKPLRIAHGAEAADGAVSVAGVVSAIGTGFHEDRTGVDAIRASLGASWQLGDLEDGEEYLAIALRPALRR